MEGLTLRYYLSLFSFIILFIYFIYVFNFNSFNKNNKIIEINKGESIVVILDKIAFNENIINKKIYYIYLYFYNKYYKQINYGRFQLNKQLNVNETLEIITKKSNIDYRITIIEGWEKYQLDKYLSQFYENFERLNYNELIADTYLINSSNSFVDFKKFMHTSKDNFFKKHKANKLLQNYGAEKILILSSLVEKEAKDNADKLLIASVILNRLNKKMKLQIDATVIAAITKGEYKFNRKLTYKDLKIQDEINTYFIKGLPKEMISYVGKDTIEIVLKNPKSDFLFYFYNILEDKHIYSKSFNEHKTKLNGYRKKIK